MENTFTIHYSSLFFNIIPIGFLFFFTKIVLSQRQKDLFIIKQFMKKTQLYFESYHRTYRSGSLGI